MKASIKYIFLALIILGCSTSPTGRKQLTMMSSSQMDKMGANSFEELKAKGNVSNNQEYNKVVTCLSHDLLKAAGQNPSEWEVKVFNDESPNAFALPGKKIGVHTGMIKLAKNNEQLAAVIGHEIGHVLAEHGNERVSQGMMAQGGLLVANIALGANNDPKSKIALAAIGLGTQVGILLPFSRKHETEADRLGVQYMATAGYNPKQAAQLWVEMSKGGSSGPEFLSTHPSPSSRIKDLDSYANKYLESYQNNKNKSRCH